MNKVITKAAILAAGLFFILELLDGFISVPLRELSTWVSYTFLKMGSFPVDKQGTLLSTPRMSFDVIPACSGSTTMRVMIFVGILWAAMQEKMSLSRKILLTLTVIPIAIFANSLRLCALVTGGYMMYKPIEGTLHDLIGMADHFRPANKVALVPSCEGHAAQDEENADDHTAHRGTHSPDEGLLSHFGACWSAHAGAHLGSKAFGLNKIHTTSPASRAATCSVRRVASLVIQLIVS